MSEERDKSGPSHKQFSNEFARAAQSSTTALARVAPAMPPRALVQRCAYHEYVRAISGAPAQRSLIARDESGIPVGMDAGAMFEQATAGARQSVPFQAEMEESFGQDFSTVEAHTGEADAMTLMGAKAAAVDE